MSFYSSDRCCLIWDWTTFSIPCWTNPSNRVVWHRIGHNCLIPCKDVIRYPFVGTQYPFAGTCWRSTGARYGCRCPDLRWKSRRVPGVVCYLGFKYQIWHKDQLSHQRCHRPRHVTTYVHSHWYLNPSHSLKPLG
jgi:hypothetical protein